MVPLDYNPRLPNQAKVLKEHWKAMVIKNSSLKEAFPEPPMAGLRQGKNLQRLLCRARLSPPPSSRPARTSTTTAGWRRCAGNRRQCPACPYTMDPTTQVTGLYSGYTHTIRENINCQDENIIYYWKCVKDNCPDYPKCEYIGRSSRSFQQRICEHLYYAKSLKEEQPAGKHFTANGHNVSHLKACSLEKVKSRDKFVLNVREDFYIQKFDTFRNGLNQER